jgi:outer membrane protein assembly factor BamB
LCAVFFKAPGVAPVELNGSPAIVNGRVYFLTTNELVCIGKKDRKGNDAKADHQSANERAPADAKPVHLQVVPADVALMPGQSVTFKARAFDEKGRLIGEVESEWSLAGTLPPVFPIGIPAPPPPKVKPTPPPALKGKLSAMSGVSTKLTVGGNPPAQFGRVVAKMGGLTAYARVRVAPMMPYTMDFAKVPLGRTPAAWVNCQGKFAVVKMKDGTLALSKRNNHPSPIVYRTHAYIGLPSATGYTIEADVQGGKLVEMPDIGVEANRYSLVLNGNAQSLRLVSWDALPRIDKSISFPWKPNAWYRMKLTVEVQGDKAIARGKVWPRDEAEPKEWTVTVEDPCPNREGAPALYANAMGIVDATHPKTEAYFANVKITPNK